MKILQNKEYTNVNNGDLNKFCVDTIWDWNAPKYRVCRKTLHVTQATTYIGYTQLIATACFSVVFMYIYMTSDIKDIKLSESSSSEMNARYISSLLSALTLHLGLILMMLHGVRTGRRSLILPYIACAAIALLFSIIQIFMDLVTFINTSHQLNDNRATYILFNFMGIVLHSWCIKVVCKCYSYFGDKSVAESIGAQLQSTNGAFAVDFSRPPPYSRIPTDIHPMNRA